MWSFDSQENHLISFLGLKCTKSSIMDGLCALRVWIYGVLYCFCICAFNWHQDLWLWPTV